jgi:beta-lactamase superfamily II metal-dependent hydrolase
MPYTFRVCLVGLVALLASTATARAETVTGQMKIYLLNIGQGDAILIICPHGTHRLLIDSGAGNYPGSQTAFKSAMQELLPGTKPTIDVAIASHPHKDHVAGFEWVLQNFHVKKFADNGKPYTSEFKSVSDLATKLKNSGQLQYIRGTKFPSPSIADFCPASNVSAELLIPKGFGKASNVNNNSVGVVVRYNDVKLVFTGDAEKQEEKLLVDDPTIVPRLKGAAFYKAGHHGAETSSTPALLDAIDAPAQWADKTVGISAGCKGVSVNKGYRHPRAVTLNVLLSRITADATKEVRTIPAGQTEKDKWTTVQIHKRLYVTADDDSVLFVSDGSTIERAPLHLANPIGACPQ